MPESSFKPSAGDILDVKIIFKAGYDGVAKKDGFYIFVPGVKEGDIVRVRMTQVLNRVGYAERYEGTIMPSKTMSESDVTVPTPKHVAPIEMPPSPPDAFDNPIKSPEVVPEAPLYEAHLEKEDAEKKINDGQAVEIPVPTPTPIPSEVPPTPVPSPVPASEQSQNGNSPQEAFLKELQEDSTQAQPENVPSAVPTPPTAPDPISPTPPAPTPIQEPVKKDGEKKTDERDMRDLMDEVPPPPAP